MAMHSNEPRSGFDLTMSKADAADSDSTVRKHRQRGLIPWKPGQSGNPKGRPQGSRNKLSEEFFRDLCDAWQAFGKPALETMAMLYPVEFVRLVASRNAPVGKKFQSIKRRAAGESSPLPSCYWLFGG
jgi:Family of unknown function (DUF5681)